WGCSGTPEVGARGARLNYWTAGETLGMQVEDSGSQVPSVQPTAKERTNDHFHPGAEAAARPRRSGGERATKKKKGRVSMTHVVCQPCYDCKYTDCVAVCPVECFWYDEKMLYIDPQDCIDCEACVPECPVEAIFAEANVPAQWSSFTQLNAEKSAELKGSGAGHITEKQDAQEGAECKKK